MTSCSNRRFSASTAGWPARELPFQRRISISGNSRGPGNGTKRGEMYRWFYPLLTLDTHVKFVQYIKLAVQEVGLGAEWVREPRLPLAGEERERVLKIIRRGIANRPKLGAR